MVIIIINGCHLISFWLFVIIVIVIIMSFYIALLLCETIHLIEEEEKSLRAAIGMMC